MKQNLTNPNAALRHFKSLCQNANQLLKKQNVEPGATSQLAKLAPRLHRYYMQLRSFYSGRSLRRMLAAAALVIGLTPAELTAQSTPIYSPAVRDTFGLSSSGSYQFLEFADMDNDGDLDLLTGIEYGIIRYYQNIGTATLPSFAAAVDTPFGIPVVPGSYGAFPILSAGDMDGDGDIDILAGSNYGGNFNYLENTGSATAPAFGTVVQNPFGLSSTLMLSLPNLADLDGDGDLDLLANEYYANLQYFENTGSSTAPAFANPVQNPFGFSFSGYYVVADVGDLDQDGDIDILGFSYGNWAYFENTGTSSAASFSTNVPNPFSLSPSNVYEMHALGDLDGDGDLDLLTSAVDSTVSYFNYYENQPLVSVEKGLKLHGNLTVFPNPAQDQIRLSLPEEALSGTFRTTVFDLQGRQVRESSAIQSGQAARLNISGLATGMYEVVLQGESGAYRGRFMKQ